MNPSRVFVTVLLAVGLAVSGCKGDEEAESDGPTPEQIEAAKKKLADKKKATPAKDDKKKAAAKGEDDKPATKKPAAKAGARKTTVAKPKPKPKTSEADDAKDEKDLDPAEKRRLERQKRLAELKAQNEKRRQERLAKLRGATGGDDDGEAKKTGPRRTDAGIDHKNNAAGKGEAEARPRPRPIPRRTTKPAPRPVAPAGPTLDVRKYLNIGDVRRLLEDTGLTDQGLLSGIPESSTYSSVYFSPRARNEFGLALQVWIEPTRRDSNERFRRMRRDYPNAEDTNALTPKGFFSYWNDMISLTFLDFGKRTVVTVTCGQKVCTPEQLYKVATTVKDRI